MSQADSILRRTQDARSALDQEREYMEELREINRTLTHGTQVLYDHIATLKAELDAARRDTARVVDENMKLRAAINRVQVLHRQDPERKHCWECQYGLPCRTLRALDGEDA